MTDNVRGGSTDANLPLIATDDVGGVQYQVVKLDVGASGAASPITTTAGLPIELIGTDVFVNSASSGTSPFTIELPAVASKLNYVVGFGVTGQGATVGLAQFVQLLNVHSNPTYYGFTIPTGTTVSMVPLIVEFTRPVPAIAVNTAIQLAVPAFGAGSSLFAAYIHGFYR